MQNTQSSFIVHLEELRRRIIWCLAIVIIASIISYSFAGKLIYFLSKPIGKFVFIEPLEAFMAYLKISVFCGIFISFPFILYHLLAFIIPGLTGRERKFILMFLPFGCIFFAAGAVFAYFSMIPFCAKFLIGFSSSWLIPMISVGNYISFFCTLIIIFGAVFELPVVILFLNKIGIVNQTILRRNRKYVILVIFIIAAIFTPPDVFSQVIMAIPLLVLYEIGILVCCFGGKK
jgi:sec-independent protein translocase protein TatC